MDDIRVPLVDSSFSPYSKSASLREENKDVHPTYFRWAKEPPYTDGMPTFYTDNAILANDTFADNAVAWLLEPRCLRPENYEAAKAKAHLFKAVLSYDIEFLKGIHNGRWYALGGSSISFDKWGIYPKTKDVCMFVSDKRTTEGHQLRHAIMEKFGDRIDCYGEGADRPVKSKFEVLKDYQYCVVVESCWIEGYFTEKIIDALSMGCMVFYWGHQNYWRNVRGVRLFSDIDSLKMHLDYRIYRGYIKNDAEKIIHQAKPFRICEDHIFHVNSDLSPRNHFYEQR